MASRVPLGNGQAGWAGGGSKAQEGVVGILGFRV